jgi:ubiquinone/menaquinone biosynthesis C-methylase UbiE
MSSSDIKIYDKVADIYPYLMRTIRYDKWAKYIFEIVNSSVKKTDTILELGAGNGKLANYFKNYYPHIIITDLSLKMLKQDGISRGLKICCDMTRTPFNTNFNLIYSAFDSINYLTSRKKLLAFFKEIKRILNKGGIFTFDISLERNSLKHIKEPLRKGKYKGISYVQKSKYSPKSRIHMNIFNIETANEKFCENHKQKIYPFEEYFRVIDKAGLYVAECFDAFTFDRGNAECERVQFVVKN